MDVGPKNLVTLFRQLGLPSDERSIDRFIASHRPRQSHGAVWEEGFWNTAQAAFLREAWEQDADWAEAVDELATRLHKDT